MKLTKRQAEVLQEIGGRGSKVFMVVTTDSNNYRRGPLPDSERLPWKVVQGLVRAGAVECEVVDHRQLDRGVVNVRSGFFYSDLSA